MCGIVGYVGGADAAPVLLDGLKRLDCRGYDSAGIAVIDGGRLDVRRSVEKIAALERVLAREPMRGRPGLAHTRWATHGKMPVVALAQRGRLYEKMLANLEAVKARHGPMVAAPGVPHCGAPAV